MTTSDETTFDPRSWFRPLDAGSLNFRDGEAIKQEAPIPGRISEMRVVTRYEMFFASCSIQLKAPCGYRTEHIMCPKWERMNWIDVFGSIAGEFLVDNPPLLLVVYNPHRSFDGGRTLCKQLTKSERVNSGDSGSHRPTSRIHQAH